MKACCKGLVVAGVVMGLCLPLFAEQDGGARERKRGGDGVHARLSEEGRAIMRAHREQQREQMRAQMQAGREAHQGHRAAVRAESDPYKQLDLIEANIKARQEAMSQRMEEAQQARLAAYASALGASGIEGEAREQLLGRMLVKQTEWQSKAGEHGEAALAEIARLRAMPDLTTEAVRQAMRSMMQQGSERRGKDTGEGRESRPRRGREREGRQGAQQGEAAAL